MFRLNLTKALAGASFNALVLAAMEKDALNLALIRLQNEPGAKITLAGLIQEANNNLPQPNQPEAFRLFFATQHQIDDHAFDNTKDLGEFISSRAEQIERRANEGLSASKSAPQWIQVLSDLADGYSYVIEAAENLQKHGMVALRRGAELQTIMTRPDDKTQFAKAQLYDKAMAFYVERNDNDKNELREQYR